MTTRRTKRTQAIGAISGVFPGATQRALNDQIASVTLGAEMARSTDAAEMAPAPPVIGTCPACGNQRIGDASQPCPRCEMYRAQSERYYLDATGEWAAY